VLTLSLTNGLGVVVPGNAVEAVGDQRLASHGRGGGEHGWQHGLA
jgi:hypothetical protein